MRQWQVIPVAVGGVVAVGFIDEERIIVGSHSGVGLFEIQSGERVERTHDEHYGWYQGDPPWIRYPTPEGVRLVRAAGLWGGELDQATTDGWTCHRINTGVVLSAEGRPDCKIEDSEEFRAQGFSSGGCAFVYATSPTIYLASRA